MQALSLKVGNRCTKFFHRVANFHRRNNAIDMLLIDGQVYSNCEVSESHIVNCYASLLSAQFSWRPNLDGLAFESIDQSSSSWLGGGG